MPLQEARWDSLEIAKLLVAFLTPVSVAVLGLFVSRRLKRIELVQWSNQKLIEKRLVVYDAVAPLLNKLLCFYTWVGDWKNISPDDVVKAKRELDLAINVYRYLFDDEVYKAYQGYIHALFEVYGGAGTSAKIRSRIKGPDGDRTLHCAYTWNPSWSEQFVVLNVEENSEVRRKYYQLMGALQNSLGVHR